MIASSDSQRQTVTPEICSQIPRATASRASSPDDQRASGTSLSAGSSHARRITSQRAQLVAEDAKKLVYQNYGKPAITINLPHSSREHTVTISRPTALGDVVAVASIAVRHGLIGAVDDRGITLKWGALAPPVPPSRDRRRDERARRRAAVLGDR